MTELAERQIEHGMSFYYAAGIICLVGVITLFFYPVHGVGLIAFGGCLVYWSLAHVVIAVNRDISAKLTEIIRQIEHLKQTT